MPASRIWVRTLLIACFAAAIIQANVGLSSAQPNPKDNSPSLFTEVSPNEKATLDAQASKFHKSSKAAANNFKSTLVRVDYIHLKWNKLIETAIARKPTILRLFNDLSVEFIPQRFGQIPQSAKAQDKKKRFRWSGRVKVKGREIGQVVFVVNMTDRSITGTIRYQGRAFRIRPFGNDRYEVTELELEGFPEEDLPKKRDYSGRSPARNPTAPDRTVRHDVDEQLPPPEGPEESRPESRPDTMGSLCSIDVMVLYTDDAKAASFDIEDEIYEALVQSNVTFENSQVNTIVQPVYIGLINFQESQMLSIRNALDEVGNAATVLGINVNNLREKWGADLVSLWVENGGRDEGYCGIGYQTSSDGPSDIDGFTVVRRDCATGSLSFTHEMGHNLGLGHDRYSEGATGRSDETSNYGHVSLTYAQRTMMATNRECREKLRHGCERLSFWSSPDFTYPDSRPPEPMGIGFGKTDAADNAAIARRTTCQVANFR